MSVYETIIKRRTIRKFKQTKIERKTLEKMVNAARYAPSGANLQPLKYIIADKDNLVKAIFEQVKWAAYIFPEGNPGIGEEPVAFIAVLADTDIRKSGYEPDVGAAVQNILLTAAEEGIGTCWMGAIDRDKIRQILNIQDRYILDTVIALGYPDESPVAIQAGESIKYFKDNQKVLNVPKRSLKEIIIE